MFSAVAGAFGGLIAFGVQHIHSATADWRLLFIIEGIPTILLGILSLFILPDRLEETSVLTEREREIAMERMNRGTKADVGRVIQRRKFIQVFWGDFPLKLCRLAHILMALRDWKVCPTTSIIYSIC